MGDYALDQFPPLYNLLQFCKTKILYFSGSFRFPANQRESIEVPHRLLHPNTCTASPQIDISRQVALLLQWMNLHGTHHHHPESIAYVRVHSWWCRLYGFGPIYSDVHPPLEYHTLYVPCPKIPLWSAYSSLPPPNPW